MLLSEFDYDLPAELIAQHPLPQRDASRMLVLDRGSEKFTDSKFRDFPGFVQPHDVLVVNNTSVFAARLNGRREPSGGKVEVLLVREVAPSIWQALVRPGARLKEGDLIKFGGTELRAEILDTPGSEMRQIRFTCQESFYELLDEIGQVPLPPYIKRPQGTLPEDRARYQTVFAQQRGAIAAPTAGLHFTQETVAAIKDVGTKVVEITLHVGYGTFEPVRVDEVSEHKVAPEYFHISDEAAEIINSARGRVIAVGTTTTRALEAATGARGNVAAGANTAALTITPGYKFKQVDALLTNFHLPRSSLLLLVSAFVGRDFTLTAYRHAVEARYRFYSYGDCMFAI
jgi:S-adenosylmethionine:tRNA ribosyltransferase-isomerase